jgi:hypothetical protein
MSHTPSPKKRARRDPKVRVVTGMESAALSKAEFARRFPQQFYDPRFAAVSGEIDAVTEIAWRNYHESRKSPRTRKAGRAFDDPKFELPLEWLEARAAGSTRRNGDSGTGAARRAS